MCSFGRGDGGEEGDMVDDDNDREGGEEKTEVLDFGRVVL